MMPSVIQQPKATNHLPDGVEAIVTHMNGESVVQGVRLEEVLHEALNEEANVHKALFDHQAFDKVVNLIAVKKIQAYFLIMSLKNCRPKFAGCTVQLPTVLTKWIGSSFLHYSGVYVEDFIVSSALSEKIKEEFASQHISNGLGLGAFFERERIKIAATNKFGDFPDGIEPAGLVVECGSQNKAAICLLKKFGASLETNPENAVLQFYEHPNISENALNYVEIVDLISKKNSGDAVVQPNAFVASWSGEGGEQQLALSFTEAISTFSSKKVIRVQATSSGNLTPGQNLKDALMSLFMAAQTEIIKRGWLLDDHNFYSTTGFFEALRIHANHEPEVLSALKKMGAMPHFLGTQKMIPAIVEFNKISHAMMGVNLPSAMPFEVVSRPFEAFVPLYMSNLTKGYHLHA